jgi:ribosomal-protein-alanine N-acetyltransferase
MALLSFRAPQSTDLPTIKNLNLTVQPLPWSEEALTSELRHPDFWGLLAEFDGQIAGYLFCRKNGETAEVMTLGVRMDFQKMGVAVGLFEKFFRSLGRPVEVFLEVKAENTKAISLYKKLGFELTHIRKAYYADGSDGLAFKLHLAKTLMF